jgi:glycosyltransferase involved in cell wall biosynthesis
MMDYTPQVDVIMAVHNGEEFLAQALESIRNQSYTGHTTIVVDDASTDRSLAIARTFEGVSVVQSGRVRQAGALNVGLETTTASYLAFLDADDLWTPKKLELQLQYLTNHPEVEGVFGATRQFTSSESVVTAETMQWLDEPQIGVSLTTLLIRRHSFFKVGQFNTDPHVNHLVEWYSRALSANLIFHWIRDTLVYRRVHAQNMTRVDRSNVFKGYFGALKLKLDQQRSQPETE